MKLSGLRRLEKLARQRQHVVALSSISGYDMLERTQKGNLDITLWLEWFLGCLDRALDGAESTLAAVFHKAEFWKMHAAETINERQRGMLNRLLDGFEGKLTSSKWATIEKCSPDTALRDITELVELGMLKKDPGGGRSTSYSLVDSSGSYRQARAKCRYRER